MIKYVLNLGSTFKPTGIPGSAKYGQKVDCNLQMLENMNLPEGTKKDLLKIGSHSLAQSTWSNYKTAEKMLGLCESEKKIIFSWPMNESEILIFIAWALVDHKVTANTTHNYLAGIRHMHIMKGLTSPEFYSEKVKFFLRGQQNKESFEKLEEKFNGRLPATISVMKLLKEEIRLSNWDKDYKLMFWAACTIMFNGAFRGGEILSKTESTFDPRHTLLTRDVKVSDFEGTKILNILLKNPKELKKGKSTVVDVYQSNGPLCPVKAYQKWQNSCTSQADLPLFRDKSGTPLTLRKMNIHLKFLMDKHIPEEGGKFSSHSFRIGLATVLGERGFGDKDIKAAGRWSSRVFNTYCVLPRTQRATIAKEIGAL